MAILPVIATSRGEAEEIEKLMPADGTGAATKEQDVGTSPGSLAKMLHQLRDQAEGDIAAFVAAHASLVGRTATCQ
jgi:hypothetical protein